MKHTPLLAAPLLLLATGATAPVSPQIPYAGAVVAAWTFEEGKGDRIRDVGPHGMDAVMRDGAWTQGVRGTGVEFDGLGGHVALQSGTPSELSSLEEGTISLWFRFDDVPGTDTIHPLFYVGDGLGGPGNSELIIEVGHFGSKTQIYFTVVTNNEVIPQCFNSFEKLVPGELYHFAAVVDQLPGPNPNRGTNTGYLNGRELDPRHYRFGGKNMAHFLDDVVDPKETWFGRGYLSQVAEPQELDGLVDEVIVWDRPLTQAEVLAYYRGARFHLEGELED